MIAHKHSRIRDAGATALESFLELAAAAGVRCWVAKHHARGPVNIDTLASWSSTS